jgi:choline dehydrogenase-like flavoprotein
VISDLEAENASAIDADVLIIGAGTVGLIVAYELAQRGRRIAVVESGGEHQVRDTHALNEVVQTGATYAGAARGRFRCLGGTSTRWGGALIPFAEADCRADEWPLEPSEVLHYVQAVESLFRLNSGPYYAEPLFTGTPPDYCGRLAKWPKFKYRNVAALLRRRLHALPNLRVWLNATATNFEVTHGSLRVVTARSPSGRALRISAREIVVTAGAIESTRLLLLIDEQNGNALFEPDGQLGRFFSDHLSVPVADVEPLDRGALNRLVGFRFERDGSMRNIRFELSDVTELRKSIPACFAHVAFSDSAGSGFDAVRDILRCVQRRRLPPLRLLFQLAASTPWLLAAVWWRYVRRRLLYPWRSTLHLHMVIEQLPRAESQIRLSRSRKDVFGQPLAELAWDVSPDDIKNLNKATDAFVAAWSTSAIAAVARLRRHASDAISAKLMAGGGIFHPVGSVRMARQPSLGVVDKDLRTFRVPNLSVASTAVLPRAGGANPTMMLLCLGMRLVDRIDQQLTHLRE